jgi:hypothetical protein
LLRAKFLGQTRMEAQHVGVLAAYQRDYFRTSENSCATAGTIALTVVVGPLNYAGVNPKVTDCDLPEPSQ